MHSQREHQLANESISQCQQTLKRNKKRSFFSLLLIAKWRIHFVLGMSSLASIALLRKNINKNYSQTACEDITKFSDLIKEFVEDGFAIDSPFNGCSQLIVQHQKAYSISIFRRIHRYLIMSVIQFCLISSALAYKKPNTKSICCIGYGRATTSHRKLNIHAIYSGARKMERTLLAGK